MNETKVLEKNIKKLVNSTVSLIKKDYTKDIDKTLAKLKLKMTLLNLGELEQAKNNKDLLDKKYQECLQIKKDTEKIFSNIKGLQLNLNDINKDLQEKNQEIINYMSEIEKCLKTDSDNKLTLLNAILIHNKETIKENIEKNQKLVDSLSVAFGVALDTFKNYTDKIFFLKRKIYE